MSKYKENLKYRDVLCPQKSLAKMTMADLKNHRFV